MIKIFKENIKEKIKSSDLKREITVEIDGEKKVLSEAGLVEYLKNIFDGGKSIGEAEREMIKNGIKDKQWERRKEIINLLKKISEEDAVRKAG